MRNFRYEAYLSVFKSNKYSRNRYPEVLYKAPPAKAIRQTHFIVYRQGNAKLIDSNYFMCLRPRLLFKWRRRFFFQVWAVPGGYSASAAIRYPTLVRDHTV